MNGTANVKRQARARAAHTESVFGAVAAAASGAIVSVTAGGVTTTHGGRVLLGGVVEAEPGVGAEDDAAVEGAAVEGAAADRGTEGEAEFGPGAVFTPPVIPGAAASAAARSSRILLLTVSFRHGLLRNAEKPRLRQRFTSCCMVFAVTAITGVVKPFARICCSASVPLIT